MSSNYLLPMLDTDGWLNTPIKVADALLSHFFLSDYSQTAVFPGSVASFAWIVSRYAGDVGQIASQTQSILADYFSTQFNNVDIQVASLQNTTVTINVFELTLYMTFVDGDGVTQNLARIVQYDGLKVTNIIAVVNNG